MRRFFHSPIPPAFGRALPSRDSGPISGTPLWERCARGLGQDDVPLAPTATAGQLATTMVMRGAVGTLIGAAAAPEGKEGIWGAVGFVMGATLGEIGIVGVALASLWRKAG